MSLIEKAYSNAANTEHSSVQADNVRQLPVRTRSFDIDLTRMAGQGFFVPSHKPEQLALELRLLKRRLLRRIGFLRSQRAHPSGLGAKSAPSRNVVMVTSTRPAEGKTFTAINLALSLALEDEIDVTLIDGDAPRPKVQSHFGLRQPAGFTDLIMDEQLRPEDVLLQARQGPLFILPEGNPVDYPADLFSSARGQKVIRDIASQRPDQLVIIDAPPVLATTEAVMLAPYVDEIIFVVEADSTPEQAIASAVEELLDFNPNISLVLNKCLIGAGGSHYGSYAEYYARGSRRRMGRHASRSDAGRPGTDMHAGRDEIALDD